MLGGAWVQRGRCLPLTCEGAGGFTFTLTHPLSVPEDLRVWQGSQSRHPCCYGVDVAGIHGFPVNTAHNTSSAP